MIYSFLIDGENRGVLKITITSRANIEKDSVIERILNSAGCWFSHSESGASALEDMAGSFTFDKFKEHIYNNDVIECLNRHGIDSLDIENFIGDEADLDYV